VKIKGVLKTNTWVQQIDMELDQKAPYKVTLGERGLAIEVTNDKNTKSIESDTEHVLKPPPFIETGNQD